jgi:hypothetical protein
MVKRGNTVYVPREMLDEMESTMNRFQIKKEVEAWRLIAKQSRIGRELRATLNYCEGRKQR